jgi:hypothetical protein
MHKRTIKNLQNLSKSPQFTVFKVYEDDYFEKLLNCF